uniref:Uncharacterized protein n=1 Tax=Faecalibaculum rodentium TaxID=1702221 RepID=A0A140DW64_9FIRM|nr:hypothetical protein AALO17_17570 [Faecalibaculum rodentium]
MRSVQTIVWIGAPGFIQTNHCAGLRLFPCKIAQKASGLFYDG